MEDGLSRRRRRVAIRGRRKRVYRRRFGNIAGLGHFRCGRFVSFDKPPGDGRSPAFLIVHRSEIDDWDLFKICDTLSYGTLLPATEFTDFTRWGFRELRACVQRQVRLICALSAACSPLLVSIFNLCPPPACREQRRFRSSNQCVCYEPSTTLTAIHLF